MIETAGIATVSVMNFRAHAQYVKPPRVVLVRYPFGGQWGPPGNVQLQQSLIDLVLDAFQTIDVPGTILDAPREWRNAFE